MNAPERRLQVIVFTDVKGYTAMMSADEATTVRVVAEHRELVRAALARHGGREIRTVGDAFLILFDAVVPAVSWATEVQEALLARNATLPAREQVWLRIGLHLGDVRFDADGEISGDAVNLASRVEPLAPVGGICLTEPVAAQARQAAGRPLEPLSAVPLKNIAHPPALFVIHIAPRPRAPSRWCSVALRAATVLAVLALVAVVVAWFAPRPGPPPEWPVVSDEPAAQEAFERAAEALKRADSRLPTLADAAAKANPDAPLAFLLLALSEPMGGADQAALQRAVSLVAGRDDPTARLVRLADTSVREQEGGVGIHVGSTQVADWDRWIAENPDDALGQFIAASTYPIHGDETDFHAGDPEREHLPAIKTRTFLAAHPDWAGARVAVALGGSPLRDAEVPALLDEGLALDPGNATLRAVRGLWHARHGRVDEARAELLHALELDPAVLGAREALASLALLADDDDERRRLVQSMLAPETPPALRAAFATTHAHELARAGRVAEGRALLERAIAEHEARRDADAVGILLFEQSVAMVALEEPALARAALKDLEAWMARPDPSAHARRIAAARLLSGRVDIAYLERDLTEIRHIQDTVARLPPGSLEESMVDPIRRNCELTAAVLSGDDATARLFLDEMRSCQSLVGDGVALALLRQTEEALGMWRAAVNGACADDPLFLFKARLYLAEHTPDAAERAAQAEAIRAKSWRHADPDLALSRRRAALLAPPP